MDTMTLPIISKNGSNYVTAGQKVYGKNKNQDWTSKIHSASFSMHMPNTWIHDCARLEQILGFVGDPKGS